MATASRDLATVDLRGLKPHLARLAASRGLTLSGVIRELLADAARLPQAQPRNTDPDQELAARVRISMRLSADDATSLAAAARATGLSLANYVVSLRAQVPAVQDGPGRTEHLRALAASTAELASLSRSIRHLNELVEGGSFTAANQYADVIASLDDDARRHLRLAARTMSDLLPRRPGCRPAQSQSRTTKGRA